MASAYGNSSDSEEDQGDLDIVVEGHESNDINSTSGKLPSHFRDSHPSLVTELDRQDDIPSTSASYEDYMHHRFESNLSHQSFDHSFENQDYKITSGAAFINARAVPDSTSNCSQSDEDSCRMHVFCLEHAAEAEKRLRPIGGANILLLCHPGLGVD